MSAFGDLQKNFMCYFMCYFFFRKMLLSCYC